MAGRKARTGVIKAAGKTRRRDREPDDEPTIDLPDEHTARHAQLLPARPSGDQLAAWLEQVAECARLRCPYLDDRVAAAGLPPDELLAALEPTLAAALAAPDAAGAATVLGALRPLLAALPNRTAAKRWFKKWRPKLDAARSCPDDDRCPACRERRPCPLDTWHQPVAAAALGRLDTGQSARSFLHTSGVDTGRGVFTTWHTEKLAPLADHAAWLVHQHWMATGQRNRAELVGRYAWAAGGRDPRLVAAHARRVAAAASAERLIEARKICDEALGLYRGDSTDDGWTELPEVRNRIAGQLARRQLRPSGKVDKDMNPIPVRRHHPDHPERTRRGRFSLERETPSA